MASPIKVSPSQWDVFLLQSSLAQLCASGLWLTYETGSRFQIIPHIWLLSPAGPAGLLEAHHSADTIHWQRPISHQWRGLPPCCDKSINGVGGRLRGQAVNWQASPQILGPAIFFRGGWWGVMGFIWLHQARFCYCMQLWKTCTLAPLIPLPFSDWPWQGMLGPAGHAGNAIGYSHGKKKNNSECRG